MTVVYASIHLVNSQATPGILVIPNDDAVCLKLDRSSAAMIFATRDQLQQIEETIHRFLNPPQETVEETGEIAAAAS